MNWSKWFINKKPVDHIVICSNCHWVTRWKNRNGDLCPECGGKQYQIGLPMCYEWLPKFNIRWGIVGYSLNRHDEFVYKYKKGKEL